ncbi:GvpL/GvpF family gas vesicle protein [Nocardia sp. NPDC059228]|uniref:GvpL/GvpF family gas vesicle protein n=1 Tax=Nocardia sp. NPDC059228 TaxID=3346777 RepID=UPI003683843E
MTADDAPSEPTRTQSDPNTALLIYGIVPADAHLELQGIGRYPAPIRTVRHGSIAAVVSEVPVEQSLDRAEDLRAFANLVDDLVSAMPVIPVRFGAALVDGEAVETGLLQPNAQRFQAALDELSGQAEYLVRGHYVEDTVLREILDENPQAAALRDAIGTTPPDASDDARIALGEIVNTAMEDKRHADSETLIRALAPLTGQMSLRPSTQENEVADIAVLMPLTQEKALVRTVDKVAELWSDRVHLRVVGPLAAWDFLAVEPDRS